MPEKLFKRGVTSKGFVEGKHLMGTPRQRSSSAKRNGKAAASPAVLPQKPASLPVADDREGWHAHRAAQGQPWRAESEIDQKRQAELEQCRAIVPNIEQGYYPFKGMKLNRADVEWLLATHENGQGPVDWRNEDQRKRKGLDVRGADLSHVDLHDLPLACLQGGLWWDATEEQRVKAAVFAEGANLSGAQLQQAHLVEAHLKNANLRNAQLQRAKLGNADLKEADLTWAQLELVDLTGAQLQGAKLSWVKLEQANLAKAQLEGAILNNAQLQGTKLYGAHLEGADLRRAQLQETDLDDAFFGSSQGVGPRLADVKWGDTNLAVVHWSQVTFLSDEHWARQNGKAKDKKTRLREYEGAVRANRQLAVALQAQGLNEVAGRLAYRAQILQRGVLWYQIFQSGAKIRQRLRMLGAWLFSWFLFLIAGYGYRPGHSFLAYLLFISGFATAYYFLGHAVGPMLSPLGAFVFSMTSFHGRGFFPGNNISLDDPLAVLAAFEALVGLIIEVTFIATLTQRFFNR